MKKNTIERERERKREKERESETALDYRYNNEIN